MKFNPYPWLCMAVLMAVSFWVRGTLIESSEIGFVCAETPGTLQCRIRWLFMVFIHYKEPNFFVLFLGLLAAATRSGLLGFLTVAIGAVGLVVFSKDYVSKDYIAVGFLLGALTLARAQLEEYRHQHGTGQQQADQGPT